MRTIFSNEGCFPRILIIQKKSKECQVLHFFGYEFRILENLALNGSKEQCMKNLNNQNPVGCVIRETKRKYHWILLCDYALKELDNFRMRSVSENISGRNATSGNFKGNITITKVMQKTADASQCIEMGFRHKL